MRRLVDHWWLVGCTLLVAVVALTCVVSVEESDQHDEQQRAAERQAVSVLSGSVHDVLAREVALARVVGTLSGPLQPRWPVLSTIVMSQTLADSAAFIQPVSQRDRAGFEARTGLRLFESPRPGVDRVAVSRPLHLVVTAYQLAGGGPLPLGLDLAANPLRRALLARAAQTDRQLATPPVEFLTRRKATRGVAVYVAVRDRRGRLKGWVSAAYATQQLASMVGTRTPGVALTIRDGASTLISGRGDVTGRPTAVAVAGRRWSVWATAPAEGMSAVPWLVLCLGLTLTGLVVFALRQAAARTRRSTRELEQRDVEEAAFGRIATLVAQGKSPELVFTSIAEEVATVLSSCVAAVSRFEEAANRGTIVGAWSDEGQDLSTVPYALDGVTAAAHVFRTGRAARTVAGYAGGAEPSSSTMTTLRRKDGVAAPITVAGELWGALGAAYRENQIPAGVEVRLERFASLVGLAVSNADAWEKLESQASTDPLTGIANRRTFRERLTAEVARAERYGRHLSLALMDLDHFKAVNDLHGHQSGDWVLVAFAQLLSAHSRQGELVVRIGGEEFAWLMPETDPAGARIAAERVRAALASRSFGAIGQVTVSAGICSTDDAGDADALVRCADRALYRAKDSGRNTTMLYTGETGDPRATTLSATAERPAFLDPS